MDLWKGLRGAAIGLSLCLYAASPSGHAANTAEPPANERDAVRLSWAPYAKISARRLETMRLTREGKFDAVEALLTPLQQAYERKEVDEFAVATAFAPFSTSDETLRPALDRWVAQAPKSYSARLARARYNRARHKRYRDVEVPHSEAAIGAERVRAIALAAIADYRAALEMNPRLMIAYADLLDMAVSTDNRDLFRETHEQAFAIAPDTWVVRDALIYTGAVPRDQYGAFLADAAKYQKQNPLLLQIAAQPELAKAEQLWRNRRHAEALEILDKQLQTLDTFMIRKDRAHLLRIMDRFPEAYAEIDRAIALMPGKHDGYRQRGWMHQDTERWAEAAADYRHGLEIDPLEPMLNAGLGEALVNLGDTPGGIEALELSARWSADAHTYQRIGSLYLKKLGKTKESLAALDRAVALAPNEKWNWYMRAETLDKMGDPRAIESFERYLALVDPKSPEDQKYIAFAKHKVSGPKVIPKPPANAAH
jgi:tetratricopeptide (TPR) repeat protein